MINILRKIKHKLIRQESRPQVEVNPYLRNTFNDYSYYETPQGCYYLPDFPPQDVVMNHMKTGTVFEPEIVEVAKKFIKPGTVVLDVGANFGQMSTIFSKLVGEAGQVLSFEADDYVYGFLQKNLEANNCKNVKAYFNAVFNRNKEIVLFPKQDFKRFGAYGSYGIDLNAAEGREVVTLTIDSIAIEQPISFMKVDIQGSDLFALQGAVNTIQKHKMPIIFEFEQQFQDEFHTSFQDYVEFTDAIGYRFQEIVMDINYLIVPK